MRGLFQPRRRWPLERRHREQLEQLEQRRAASSNGSNGGMRQTGRPRGAPGTAAHGFCFTPRGTVELSFTDNVLLTATNRKADYITIPTAGFNLTGRTPHTNVTIDGSAFYDFYGATTRFNGVGYTGLADVKTDIIDKYVTLDARAATNEQNVNPLGASPASQRTFGQNQAQVLNYGATPDFHWRAGDFFTADTKYDISFVNYLPRAAASTCGDPRRQYGTAGSDRKSKQWPRLQHSHLDRRRIYYASGSAGNQFGVQPSRGRGIAAVRRRSQLSGGGDRGLRRYCRAHFAAKTRRRACDRSGLQIGRLSPRNLKISVSTAAGVMTSPITPATSAIAQAPH